jgi:hypothetical protein
MKTTPLAKTPKISTLRAIATDPQLWLPLAVLGIGIGVLALVK